MASIADIYKQEKLAGKGLGSALGKKALEKIDPRRILDQSGLLVTMFPALKAYSALSRKQRKEKDDSSNLDNKIISSIAATSALTAKNTMVLPAMARDMNLMRSNIQKLVKLSGGTATTKADMFFKRAGERETLYESAYKKIAGVSGGKFSLGRRDGQTKSSALFVEMGDNTGKDWKDTILEALGLKSLFPGGKGGKGGKGKPVKGRGKFGLLGGAAAALGGAYLGEKYLEGGNSGYEGIAEGAAAALGVYGAKQLIQPKLDARVQEKIGPKQPTGFNEKTGRYTGESGKMTSAKNAKLEKALEGLRKYYLKIEKVPGLRGYVLKKIIAKFSIPASIRLSSFLAGLAAAPFTAGLSATISLVSWGLTAALLIEIYEWWTENEDNLIKSFEMEKKAEEAGSPTPADEMDMLRTEAAERPTPVTEPMGPPAPPAEPMGPPAPPVEPMGPPAPESTEPTPHEVPAGTIVAPAAPMYKPEVSEGSYKRRTPMPVPTSPPEAPKTSPGRIAGLEVQNKITSLLDVISTAESATVGNYNAMNQGTVIKNGKRQPAGKSGDSKTIIGMNLTDMTIGQILNRAAGNNDSEEKRIKEGKIFAAGRYQIIPKTLKGLVDAGVVKLGDKFDEKTQDKLATALLNEAGLKRWLSGDMTSDQFQNNMAKIWAGLPTTSGKSFYDEKGVNKSNTKAGQMLQEILNTPTAGQNLQNTSTIVNDAKMAAMQPATPIAQTAQATPPKKQSNPTAAGSTQTADAYNYDIFQSMVGSQYSAA